MKEPINMHVAIIGAGIAGLSLALTLNSRGIQCTLYEAKEAAFPTTGALMLAPNALRIFDSLRLYRRLQSRGFNFETVEFRTERDEITDVWRMGSKELYGYQALRIKRPLLLQELRAAVEERGIEIQYQRVYSHVVEETGKGVTFELTDGTRATTDALIGADGINSKVRANIAPAIKPTYGGKLFLLATTRRRLVHDGEAFPQTTFYNSRTGAFHVMPQELDGSETCLGKQCSTNVEVDVRQLQNDKQQLYSLFMQDTDDWPDDIQDLLKHVDADRIVVWPMQNLESLPRWTTLAHRRVILIGDAAHAIQPQGGQGSCQAVEDAYTLAMVLARALRSEVSEESWINSIATWQMARTHRVDKAKMFTTQLGNNRLPPLERQKLPKGTYWEPGHHPDLSWLYGAGLANSDAKGVTRVEVRRQGAMNIVGSPTDTHASGLYRVTSRD